MKPGGTRIVTHLSRLSIIASEPLSQTIRRPYTRPYLRQFGHAVIRGMMACPHTHDSVRASASQFRDSHCTAMANAWQSDTGPRGSVHLDPMESNMRAAAPSVVDLTSVLTPRETA